ncbi:hypothetical protein HB976_14620 [Yersinia mollaretii]|uniref:hypothetical protein n=1 Tax=Yersinia mollaretii TaxID=33060 RepID=UPI00061CBAC7|nr:hypothetical protein [Yersinia mollaretii]MDA5536446.1 hypothetical protein [Yersinia mollaretii]NIL04180.1 hypothetical protein [Yersinia mollaretii]CNI40371.1 Uncharacterised protein [Yersinia mollaretii]
MINANKAVEILNELLILDPAAITLLAGTRVACSDRFATDSTAMCGKVDGVMRVGMVGVINAMVEGGFIGAEYDDDSVLVGFRVVKG